MKLWLAGAAVLLAGTVPAKAAERCTAPFGMSAITNNKARFVVFGEVHGTNEAPAFVGDVACTLAARGEAVLVAIEIDAGANRALQAAWDAPHEQFAGRLRSAYDWSRTPASGQDSQAVFDMLVRLHAAKAMGARISIVSFNGDRPGQVRKYANERGQNRDEAVYAANLRLAQLNPPFPRTIVLVGAFHASRTSATVGGVAVRPMAARLGKSVLNFDLATAGGQAWNCEPKPSSRGNAQMSTGDLDCRPHPFRTTGDVHGTPRLILKSDLPAGYKLAPGFDGVFYVGPVTPASPVR